MAHPSCIPGGKRYDLQARFAGQLAHSYQVLCDLCEPLLVLMHQELGPERHMLIDLHMPAHSG